MTWINRCHFGDVREVLRRMAADGVKVNTIVTSPPYWGLRSYLPADHPDKKHEIGSEKTFAEFLAKMVDVFELCREVLADDGTMWINMGDSYASGDRTHLRDPDNKNTPVGIGQRRPETPAGLKPKDIVGQPWRLAFALQEAGWYLRQDIIWAKPNPMPESMDEALSDMRDTRNRRSVWTVPSEPYSGAHFATFPTRLIEPCIMAGCPEGGTVLDIFFGSGTTGEVAQDLGRNWIGIDLNRANEPLQQQRLANKDQRRRQRGLLLEAA